MHNGTDHWDGRHQVENGDRTQEIYLSFKQKFDFCIEAINMLYIVLNVLSCYYII